jgi:SAM-dependent methyltransferase
VGEFEKMYKDEDKDCFDSWHQEDSRQLNRNIALSIINGWNFNNVLDIGCGKGALTHLLKKNNNRVLGIDISETAIEKAKARYPDIEFEKSDISVSSNLVASLKAAKGASHHNYIDLVFTAETFSYLESWEDIVQTIAQHSKYILISLFIPQDPIGFVKSADQLEAAVDKSFEIIENVSMKKSRFVVIFAKSKLNVED